MQTMQELLHKYLEGELTPEEGRALDEWCKASDENARLCAEVIVLHYLIREHLVGRNLNALFAEAGHEEGDDPGLSAVLGEALALEASARQRRQALQAEADRQRGAEQADRDRSLCLLLGDNQEIVPARHIVIPRVAVYGALVALVLLAVALVLRTPGEEGSLGGPLVRVPPPPAPAEPVVVARLIDVVDAQWEGASPSVGDSLVAANYRLGRGVAHIAFDDGAEVLVEGPAAFRLEAANAIRLLSGRLVGRAPSSAGHLVVHTPNARIVDLGTEFGVVATDDGQSIVRVFEGRVALAATTRDSASQSAGLELAVNESGRVDHAGEIHREPTSERFLRHVPTPYEWQMWRSGPHAYWRLNDGTQDGTVVDAARAGAHGRLPAGARFVSAGKLPTGSAIAVRFEGDHDGIRVGYLEGYDPKRGLSVHAWVKPSPGLVGMGRIVSNRQSLDNGGGISIGIAGVGNAILAQPYAVTCSLDGTPPDGKNTSLDWASSILLQPDEWSHVAMELCYAKQAWVHVD